MCKPTIPVFRPIAFASENTFSCSLHRTRWPVLFTVSRSSFGATGFPSENTVPQIAPAARPASILLGRRHASRETRDPETSRTLAVSRRLDAHEMPTARPAHRTPATRPEAGPRGNWQRWCGKRVSKNLRRRTHGEDRLLYQQQRQQWRQQKHDSASRAHERNASHPASEGERHDDESCARSETLTSVTRTVSESGASRK